MSRGLGRWQRLLLHELYHNPNPPGFLETEPSIRIWKLMKPEWSASEDSAVHRAARSLVAKGWARSYYKNYTQILLQVTPAPDIDCPQCGLKCSQLSRAVDNSEHLERPGKCSQLRNAVHSSEHLERPAKTVAGRKMMHDLAIQLDSLAYIVNDTDPGEVDYDTHSAEIHEMFCDLETIRTFLDKVNVT